MRIWFNIPRVAAALVWLMLPTLLPAKGFVVVDIPKTELSPDCKAHPVNLLGDARKELALLKADSFRVFGFEDDKPILKQTVQIPAARRTGGRIYYSFARLGTAGMHQLVLLTPEGVYAFPSDGNQIAAEPQMILKKDLIQGQSVGPAVQYFDFALDLDNDGLDDLLVPERNGFSIFRQTAPGAFEPVTLPRNPYKRQSNFRMHQQLPTDPVRLPAISASLSQSKGVEDLLIFDGNGDGLQDLKYMTRLNTPASKLIERHEIFFQRKGMTFGETPSQVIEIPYEPTDQTFRDVNSDGRLDAIIVKSNTDLVSPRTVIKFYISGTKNNGTFEQETERFVTKDPIGLVRVADFNGDRNLDFAMTFFSYQFGSMEDIIDLVVANKIRFKLQFYLGHGPRGFSRRPDFEKELTLNINTDTFAGYAPVMVTDDMTGDGIMDLVVRDDEDSLSVYPSTGNLSFADSPVHTMDVPKDAEISFVDLNSDKLNDLIVSSPSKQVLTIYVAAPK